jgi:hypothetical protein
MQKQNGIFLRLGPDHLNQLERFQKLAFARTRFVAPFWHSQAMQDRKTRKLICPDG